MKNAINYFYNINVDSLRMIGEDYYFFYDNKEFIFQKLKDFSLDYQSVFELNKILIENNAMFFKIIPNQNNEIITNIADKKYVLLLNSNLYDRKFNYYDIIKTNISISNSNKLINRLNRSNWVNMWENKIDFFESFISQNINKYLILNKYTNYFIGLGEVAISYVKDTIKEEKPNYLDNLVVSHRRIDYSNLKQLYNPLYLIIDHRSRDVSEYLKKMFFDGEYVDIRECINLANLSNYGARLLMARMLFPSFFFDLFEKVLDDDAVEKEILYLVDKMNDYELFLLKIYNSLKDKNIPEINWIKKMDYSSTLTTPNTSGTSFISIDSIPSLSVTSIMLQ
ncbi:MAG: hypothetical protein IJO43_02875 [Bacilli bacterium]|nr:hypothetical protein [Bacilli bacterium]